MIGLFDSGAGGLCVLRALRACLPQADYIYFGDTRNLPYGGRESWELLALSRRAIALLRGQGAGAILAACGTVSSTVLGALQQETALPLMGVIEPLAAAVCREVGGRPGCRVALLATKRTVEAGLLSGLIREGCGAAVLSLPCPALVAMAESGRPDACEIDRLLQPVRAFGAAVVALGCTHFSRLAGEIGAALPGVTIIDGAREAALATAAALPPALRAGRGQCRLYTSGDVAEFEKQARAILGETGDFTCAGLPPKR